MTLGFGDPERQAKLASELVDWTLHQVAVDKYHVMFWFNDGSCLLNISWRFAYISADHLTAYIFDVQAEGGRKAFDVDRILRKQIAKIEFPDPWELHLVFENGDTLIIFYTPHLRSCWFYRWPATVGPDGGSKGPFAWAVDDAEPDDVGRVGHMEHRIPPWP
jgi:hypothetical protein